MKRKNEAESLSDILKEVGMDFNEMTSFVDAGRELRKINPSLRFNMPLQEAFKRLVRSYQIEVQSRNCTFRPDQNTLEVVMNVARHMTQETPKSGLMLCGMQGNGKSTLARAILRLIRELNFYGHFKYMGEYFTLDSRIVKATDICTLHKSEDYDSIRRLKHTPVLIIDDVGEEPKEVMVFGTPLYPLREVLESRYDSLLFTILTTNLSPKDLPEHYGWRVVDRFREMYHQIAHKGQSYR